MVKRLAILITVSLTTLVDFLGPAPATRADIFQWEYINPSNPSQGKQPSTMLVPDGAGANAMPAASLSYRNLTKAFLIGADLSAVAVYGGEYGDEIIYYHSSGLTGANLSAADLTNANFRYAWLDGAIFSGAEVRGARFDRTYYGAGTGITASQLYSTASYQAHDLTGIKLGENNLAGVNLTGQNLTSANLYNATLSAAIFNQANLTDANLQSAVLTNANLSQANLTNAILSYAPLTGANLTGAEVRGANFTSLDGRGITSAQLSSTASYQAHDLTGIGLEGGNFVGVNLAGQQLANANFNLATLTGANLSGAEVRGATFSNITAAQLYSTASYQAHDLVGIILVGDNTGLNLTGVNLAGQNLTNARFSGTKLINANFNHANLTNSIVFYASDLSGANLSQTNLTNAYFSWATLTGANLTGAEVRGASLNITKAQLYSTSSYLAHDLAGIRLENQNLTGVDLVGQNLANSSFQIAMLNNANMSQANLTNSNFAEATLTGANLSGADARAANFQDATLTGANTNNLIQSNGHIAGLDLTASASLVVRDYDGNPAVAPIVVDQHLAMGATGTLRLVFDADLWNSTISFAPGIPVTRGGTLELIFSPDVNLSSQLGRTIDLFDWTGVTPSGTFAVSSPYTWNLSNLYTTGEVTLTAVPGLLPGDFNSNGKVDAADYVMWRKTDSAPAGYNAWRTNFDQPSGSSTETIVNSSVPEPTTLVLLILAVAGWCVRRGRAA